MSQPQPTASDPHPIARKFLAGLADGYWRPFHDKLNRNPALKETVPAFLRHHDKLAIYVGRTHIAVEYLGSEYETMPMGGYEVSVMSADFTDRDSNLLERIIGFGLGPAASFSMPLGPYSADLVFASAAGWEKLDDLGWNAAAQPAVYGLNAGMPQPTPGQFCRVVNAKFFDATDAGLISRHIRWLDFFPIEYDDSDSETDSLKVYTHYWRQLAEQDAETKLPLPADYKFKQLPKINSFIEVWGGRNARETDITRFLAEEQNRFILTMRFGATEVFPELVCEWQSEIRNAIKPDFFVLHTDGYADIVEFKLPDVRKNFVVGADNRETFAAWLHSYIAQTRVYAEYFEDPNNRRWFEEKFGFKVYKPHRYLVVGRRMDFKPEIWRTIASDYKDIELLNFDDLVDGVTVQFYK